MYTGDAATYHVYVVKVVSQRYVGRERTYDLEVAHPDHQFYLANGLLTSNSHAVSYALDSYMCAFLLHHHEPEWLCAYAEEYAADSDKKRARALSEIKALGYDLVRVDVNHANRTWTIIPGKKFMPSFKTVKSLGDAAVDEILEERPYRTVYDLLWRADGTWRHSKFNKRVLENLIKLGAFESMGIVGPDCYFSSYRHMHACIVENWALLKKPNGRETLDKLAAELREVPDWTREEKVAMYVELVGNVDMELIIPSHVLRRLQERGVTSIDDAVEGEKAIHWFVVVDAKPMKTKTSKWYLRVTCIGEGGTQHRMNVWGWKPGSNSVRKHYGYLGEVEKSDWGLACVPWKMREIGGDA